MNNKNIKALCLSVLLVLFMATAQAETFCVGEFNQLRVETDLIVPEGSTCCHKRWHQYIWQSYSRSRRDFGSGNKQPVSTYLYGSLRSYKAGFINLSRAKVFGDVILDGNSKNGISGRGVGLYELTVSGDIEIYGYEIAIDALKGINVQDSYIGRNLIVESNAVRNINLAYNQVGKNIIVKRNDTIASMWVEGNTAGNRVVCKGNIPVPTNNKANFAPKGVEGQCADLIQNILVCANTGIRLTALPLKLQI